LARVTVPTKIVFDFYSAQANFMLKFKTLVLGLAALPLASALQAQDMVEPDTSGLTYADLVAMAEEADLVLRAEIRRQAALEPERAPGIEPGFVRLYIEAETIALIAGNAPVGEALRYLVDMPLDSRGRAPKLKNREVLLLARSVPGRPGELQLVSESAQQDYSPALVQRLRPVLTALADPAAPPIVTGVRDALSVKGNLVGESETQIFLDTQSGKPVSITVLRRPGRQPAWGVSWGEIIDQSARPPAPESLEWYRLACALPARLPDEANLSNDSSARTLAETDYALVMGALGPCARSEIPG
jgi:hypothetical protein